MYQEHRTAYVVCTVEKSDSRAGILYQCLTQGMGRVLILYHMIRGLEQSVVHLRLGLLQI